MSARVLIAVVVALLAGLVAGRLGPQLDLRRLRGELEQSKRAAAERRPAGDAALQGVRSMLNVSERDLEQGRRARELRAQATNAAPDAASATGSLAAAGSATNEPPSRHRRHGWDPARTSNDIERVKKAWAMRADLARNSFIKRTGLDEKQQADFAVLMEGMNLRLGTAVDKWAAQINDGGQLTAETGVRMMTELGDAIVLTYDEMDRKLPEGWREQAGPRFELMRFIDPEVITPLQGLENFRGEPGDHPAAAEDEELDRAFEMQVEVGGSP